MYIIAYYMAIIDLDKIIIKQNTIGITCGSCHEELILIKDKGFFITIHKILSFGKLQMKIYKCCHCQKKYFLINT